MTFEASAHTDVGCVRTNNEDNFVADPVAGVFVMCDGMGGHKAGEVASRMTCDIVSNELCAAGALADDFVSGGGNKARDVVVDTMQRAIAVAGKRVFDAATSDPEKAGMGTTCTALWMLGNGKAILGQVGDSRLYVYRGDELHQLSEDHTYVNELLKRGTITREEAVDHPQSNVLSRAVGVQANVPVDAMAFDVDPGDTFFLCSDGLYNYFADRAEIGAELAGNDLDLGLQKLVATAKDRGGHDNITVIGVRIPSSEVDEETQVDHVAAQKRIEVLKSIPLFSHLNYSELVKVLEQTRVDKIATGDFLMREGDEGDDMFIVLSGAVNVIGGDEVLASLSANSHLGEMCMVENAARSATVEVTAAGNVLCLRREQFFGLIRTEPVIGTKLLWSMVQGLSGRLRETNEALVGARRELTLNTKVSLDDDNLEVFFD